MVSIKEEIKLLRENLDYELSQTAMSEIGRSIIVGQMIDVLVRYANPEEVMRLWNASPNARRVFHEKTQDLPQLPPGMLGVNHEKNTYELLWELCCTMNQKGYQKPETEPQRMEVITALIKIMQPYASPAEMMRIWNESRDRLRIQPFPTMDLSSIDMRGTTGKEQPYDRHKSDPMGNLVANAPSSKHYKGMAIEPLEYIVANRLDFVVGNIVKYVSRYKSKNGLDDLEKALFYLQHLIALEKAKARAE